MFKRGQGAATVVFTDAVEDDVEPTRQDVCEVLALVVDRRRAQLANQSSVVAARGAPQLEPGHPAEREQRLTDGAGGSLHEHAIAAPHPGGAVKELVRGRPAQDQRRRFCRVDARRQASQMVCPERAIGGIRPDDRHVG
ncbi:hypothetical protein, partial [Reyranella sp.]|uniref:hypothetical protein n=1 Tax=Reyranella sp. TaxID=1929291 RepID=UPI002F9234A0